MTRAPARDETAQSSGEYVGAVGFVAAIAVAVIALSGGFASSAVSVAEKAFCTVGTPLGLGPCEGGDGVDGVPPEVTPEEQATAGDYVALGDSYSSGEGADDYLEGTDDDDATKESVNDFNGWLWPGDPHNNICRRSEYAYSAEVFGAFDFQGNYVFGACSGGVMEDYYEDNRPVNSLYPGALQRRRAEPDDAVAVAVRPRGRSRRCGRASRAARRADVCGLPRSVWPTTPGQGRGTARPA